MFLFPDSSRRIAVGIVAVTAAVIAGRSSVAAGQTAVTHPREDALSHSTRIDDVPVAAPWIKWPPSREVCRPITVDARGVLRSVRAALGLDTIGRTMLRQVTAREIVFHNYESDRPYRPFITFVTDEESLIDPETGVARDSAVFAFGGFGPQPPNVSVRISTDRSVFVRRDSGWVPSDANWRSAEASRALDPWLVARAWTGAGDVRVSAQCRYRGYPRTVLTRRGIYGLEELYVDGKTGFPVKLMRDEPQYLWGQQQVEYVYMTWLRFGGTLMPAAAARLVDGDEDEIREVVAARPVPRSSTSPVAVPDSTVRSALALPGFMRPTPVDTLRLGPHVFALRNPGYTELIALSRDTVFVMDATQGDARARSDSAWIARVFPGPHTIVVVVTDLAWPHISGLRFWVASGATIVSRDISEPFLRSVVARRWTRSPDKLERTRARFTWRFLPVRDSLTIGGISVYPIDGIASEGALFAYLPDDRVLWASDYVQDTLAPTLYASEVYLAACRAGVSPRTGAAQHVPPFAWSTLTELAARMPLAGAPDCTSRPPTRQRERP